MTAHVFPRSTFSIFQYLGRLVAASDAGKIALITPQARGHAAARRRHAVRGQHRRQRRLLPDGRLRRHLLRAQQRAEHQAHPRAAGAIAGAEHLDPRCRHHAAGAIAAAVTAPLGGAGLRARAATRAAPLAPARPRRAAPLGPKRARLYAFIASFSSLSRSSFSCAQALLFVGRVGEVFLGVLDFLVEPRRV